MHISLISASSQILHNFLHVHVAVYRGAPDASFLENDATSKVRIMFDRLSMNSMFTDRVLMPFPPHFLIPSRSDCGCREMNSGTMIVSFQKESWWENNRSLLSPSRYGLPLSLRQCSLPSGSTLRYSLFFVC
jgi:hypothetical protein